MYRAPMIVIFAAACSGGDADLLNQVLFEDHDGVTIVTNPGLDRADTLAWRIDTTAAVRIGVVEGKAEYMIGKLAGALRREDGTILVADAHAHEIRMFDERGLFVRKVGRAGGGPGEYGWLTRLIEYGVDSLVVLDNEDSRATVLASDLTYIRRYRPQLSETRARSGTSHRLIGYFEDGTQLLSDYINPCGPDRGGFCEDSVAFFRVAHDGSVLARFGTFVYSRDEFYRVAPGLYTGWTEPHPQAYWRVHGNRFYYADASRLEVQIFRSDGSLERVARIRALQPKYDHGVLYPPPRMEADTAEQREMLRVLADARRAAAVPESLPFFSDMLIDRTGHIWLRSFLPEGHRGQLPRWYVLDADGVLRYAVRSPPSLIRYAAPYIGQHPQIGNDFVLTTARDAYGVETVVLYRMHKSL